MIPSAAWSDLTFDTPHRSSFGLNRAYTHRWAVLRGSSLYLYPDQKESNAEVRMMIGLSKLRSLFCVGNTRRAKLRRRHSDESGKG